MAEAEKEELGHVETLGEKKMQRKMVWLKNDPMKWM